MHGVQWTVMLLENDVLGRCWQRCSTVTTFLLILKQIELLLHLVHSLKTQKRYESQHYTASEIFFDVHLSLDNLDNEFEMSGKSLDD